VSHVSICYLNIKFLDPKIVFLTNNLIETGTQGISKKFESLGSLPPRIRELGLSLPILYPNNRIPLFPTISLFITHIDVAAITAIIKYNIYLIIIV
jgi:hypothetical protein